MITKLISISDACKAGCRYEALQARLEAQREALQQVKRLAVSLRAEPVQSRSVERRYALMIEAAVETGLGE